MNNRNEIKIRWRLVLLIALASLLSASAQAQGVKPVESRKKQDRLVEKKDVTVAPAPALELKLSTPSTAQCVGSIIELELEVVNVSPKEVELNTAGLWLQFSFAYKPAAGGDERAAGMGMNHGGGTRGERIMLAPGVSYRSSYKLPLNSDFFEEMGSYRLKTELGGVSSNEVKFELNYCGQSQEGDIPQGSGETQEGGVPPETEEPKSEEPK